MAILQKLGPRHLKAAQLLAMGGDYDTAASGSGFKKTTLRLYMTDSLFKAEVKRLTKRVENTRLRVWSQAEEIARVRDMTPDARKVLKRALAMVDEDAGVALRAAENVLDRSGVPRQVPKTDYVPPQIFISAEKAAVITGLSGALPVDITGDVDLTKEKHDGA